MSGQQGLRSVQRSQSRSCSFVVIFDGVGILDDYLASLYPWVVYCRTLHRYASCKSPRVAKHLSKGPYIEGKYREPGGLRWGYFKQVLAILKEMVFPLLFLSCCACTKKNLVLLMIDLKYEFPSIQGIVA